VHVVVAGFERFNSPPRRDEFKKQKLQHNTSPRHAINILCAPSMGVGIERYRIIPEGVNPLQASWRSLLVSRKVVCCEASTEARLNDEVGQGSKTTIPIAIGTVLTNRNGIQRLIEVDKSAHLHNVLGQ